MEKKKVVKGPATALKNPIVTMPKGTQSLYTLFSNPRAVMVQAGISHRSKIDSVR
jgi:hypothetical protein